MKYARRTALVLLAVTTALLVAAGAMLYTGRADYSVYRIDSASMEPTIPTDSIVVVDEEADIEEGDVVSFYVAGEHVTTHRLVTVNSDGTIVTQGDAMDQVDPSGATTDDIIGEVVAVYPQLGQITAFLSSPAGFASATLLIAAGCFLVAAVTDRKDEEESDEAEEEADDLIPAP